jgi:hypothetical protein
VGQGWGWSPQTDPEVSGETVTTGANATNATAINMRLMSFFMISLLSWMCTRVQGYHSRQPSRAHGATAWLASRGDAGLDAWRRPALE